MIHLLNDAHALDAGVAVIQRPVRVWTDLDQPAVLHCKNVHTAAVTTPAGGLDLLTLTHIVILLKLEP